MPIKEGNGKIFHKPSDFLDEGKGFLYKTNSS
jgi:hypothetical protein